MRRNRVERSSFLFVHCRRLMSTSPVAVRSILSHYVSTDSIREDQLSLNIVEGQLALGNGIRPDWSETCLTIDHLVHFALWMHQSCSSHFNVISEVNPIYSISSTRYTLMEGVLERAWKAIKRRKGQFRDSKSCSTTFFPIWNSLIRHGWLWSRTSPIWIYCPMLRGNDWGRKVTRHMPSLQWRLGPWYGLTYLSSTDNHSLPDKVGEVDVHDPACLAAWILPHRASLSNRNSESNGRSRSLIERHCERSCAYWSISTWAKKAAQPRNIFRPRPHFTS